MNKIYVLGSVNIDNVTYTKVMPTPGMTVEGSSYLSNLGGKGANQACAIRFLGGDVIFIGSVGDDANGEYVRKFFDSIKLSHYLKISKNTTGTASIIVNEVTGDNHIVVVPGANFDLSKEDVDPFINKMKKDDILLLQLECHMDTVCYAIKKAKQKGVVVVLNPAPYKNNLPEEVFPYIDYFIPNETELDGYVSTKLSYEEKASYLVDKGIKNVIVTLGDKGSLLVNKDGSFKVEAIKVKAIDTTAAGDTYCGAFVTALYQGKDIKEAMVFATLCSSITVTRKGAINSLPKINELNRF